MSRLPVQLSPGVNYSEIDITTVVPNVATTIGAFAGVFQWGPAEKVTTVTSEDNLVTVFGKPLSTEEGIDFHCAANFLQYGRNLKVVRVIGSNETTANSAGITGVQYLNEDDFFARSDELTSPFYARYPGVLGNSLKVVLLDDNGQANLTVGATAAVGSTTIKFTTALGGTAEENDKLIFQTSNFSQVFQIDSASGLTATLKTVVASTIPNGATVIFRSKYADLFPISADTSTQSTNLGGSNDELNVVVVDEDGLFTGTEGVVLETYQNVSKAYDAKNNDGAPNYIGAVLNNNSNYIWAGDVESLWGAATQESITTDFGDITTGFTAAGVSTYGMTGAAAGTNNSNRLYIGGYSKFLDKESVDISLLIAGRAGGDDFAETNIKLLRDLVNDRKDCVLFISPKLQNVLNKSQLAATNATITTRNAYDINSSYVVMDSGWKYIYDKYNDKFRYIPLNADIAGLCARSEFNTQAWYSPAGLNRGIIKNVIKLAFNPDQSSRDLLYVAGVNPVVTFSGEGTVLYGDKTMLKKPSAFDRINVRRLFITLEKAISTASKYSLFEFNDEFTRSQFRNLVVPYLRSVQSQRGIIDFKVVCDETNNTGSVIDANQFVADIYIKPNRSVNFIQLNFIATRTDSNFTEII
jgi:Phage tail sheath protein subtilisin-like domain/Phage tail sheath C-terminal domain